MILKTLMHVNSENAFSVQAAASEYYFGRCELALDWTFFYFQFLSLPRLNAEMMILDAATVATVENDD